MCDRKAKRLRRPHYASLGQIMVEIAGRWGPGTSTLDLHCSRRYGGVMWMVLARQERMGPQGMGWALLFMQTSTAVRRLLPQLRARLAAGKDGLAAWNWVRSCFGVREISWFSWESAGGM